MVQFWLNGAREEVEHGSVKFEHNEEREGGALVEGGGGERERERGRVQRTGLVVSKWFDVGPVRSRRSKWQLHGRRSSARNTRDWFGLDTPHSRDVVHDEAGGPCKSRPAAQSCG